MFKPGDVLICNNGRLVTVITKEEFIKNYGAEGTKPTEFYSTAWEESHFRVFCWGIEDIKAFKPTLHIEYLKQKQLKSEVDEWLK